MLIHELAQALCELDRQQTIRRSPTPRRSSWSSRSYTVMGAAGLDVSGSSVPYLARWAETAPLETIERTAELIDRLAKRIEDALEMVESFEYPQPALEAAAMA